MISYAPKISCAVRKFFRREDQSNFLGAMRDRSTKTKEIKN